MTNPAAWHPDPTGVFDHRYWDGTAWTSHVTVAGKTTTSPVDGDAAVARQRASAMRAAGATPPPPPPPAQPAPMSDEGDGAYRVTLTQTKPAGAPPSGPPPAPPRTGSIPPASSPAPLARVDDRYLWAIVAVPVVAGIVEMIVGFNPGLSTLLTVAAVASNIAFAQLDIRANPALDSRASSGGLTAWAFFLMPVYVFKRQRLLERPLMPFWMYLALFAGIIAVQLLSGATNAIDTARLEGQIGEWVFETFGERVQVECPGDQPSRAGHRFICELDDGTTTIGVRVEVLNSAGDVEWTVLG